MTKEQKSELLKALIVKKIVKGYEEEKYNFGDKKHIKLVKENL